MGILSQWYVPNHCPQTAQQFIEAQRWAIQQPQLDVERICSMPTVCGYYFPALKWAQSQLVRPSRPQIHLAISTAIAMISCQPQCGSHQNAAGNKMPHRMPHGKDRVAIALGCREALADFLWQDQWWDPWPLDARPRGSNAAIFLVDWRAWHFLAKLRLGKSETLSARTSLNCAVAGWEEHLPGQGTSPCLFFQSVPSIILSLYRSHLCKYKNHWRFLSKLAAQQTFSWRVLLSLPLAWARSVTVSLSMEAFTKWRTSHRFRFRPFETLLIRFKKHVLVDGAAAGLGSDFLRAVWAAVFDLIWIDFGSGRSCKCRTCRTCNSTSGWCWKKILSRYFAHHL